MTYRIFSLGPAFFGGVYKTSSGGIAASCHITLQQIGILLFRPDTPPPMAVQLTGSDINVRRL
jgi:hypothetical protein